MSLARLRTQAAILTAIAVFCPRFASAATLNWNNAGGGSAATAGNWLPVQVPAAADALVVTMAGTRTISWTATVGSSTSHSYQNGITLLTFSSPHFASGTCTIGSTVGLVPGMGVTSGTFATGGTCTIGTVVGAGGQMSVSGINTLFQAQNAGADLIVGNAGTGTLLVNGGGLVRVADDLTAGLGLGSAGGVTVSGTGGGNPSMIETFDANGDITIGALGDGTLNISSGGQVIAGDDVILSAGSASTSTATVGGVGSILTAKNDFFLSNNSTAGATGVATLNANPSGTVVVRNDLRVGDPNGGTGTLHLAGGLVHTHSLTMNPTNGVMDFDGGTLRIDAGSGTFGAFTLNSTAGVAALEIIRGATATGSGSLFVVNGGVGSLLVDSGASLTLPLLILTSGFGSVTVDSSATITTLGDVNLGGSSSITSLLIDHGGVVNCETFESADETSGEATIRVRGTNSRLNWSEVLYLSGDIGHAGGPSTTTVESGGQIFGTNANAHALIYPPARLNLNTSGSLATTGRIELRGLMNLDGGTATASQCSLSANARIVGRDTVNGRVLSASPEARITGSGGPLFLGSVSSNSGFDFRGTIECGPTTISLRDANSITLGDSVMIDGGTLNAPEMLINPGGGFVGVRGTVAATTFINSGTVASWGPNPATSQIGNSFVQNSGATLRLRIEGTDAGEFDRMNVPGMVTLGGTLHLAFDPGSTYSYGVPITLMTYAARSGTFSAITTSGLSPSYTVNHGSTALTLTLVATTDAEPPFPTELSFAGKSGTSPSLELALPSPADVTVELFDVRGRLVARLENGVKPAGYHRYAMPADLRRGVYFARANIAGAGTRKARVVVF